MLPPDVLDALAVDDKVDGLHVGGLRPLNNHKKNGHLLAGLKLETPNSPFTGINHLATTSLLDTEYL